MPLREGEVGKGKVGGIEDRKERKNEGSIYLSTLSLCLSLHLLFCCSYSGSSLHT